MAVTIRTWSRVKVWLEARLVEAAREFVYFVITDGGARPVSRGSRGR